MATTSSANNNKQQSFSLLQWHINVGGRGLLWVERDVIWSSNPCTSDGWLPKRRRGTDSVLLHRPSAGIPASVVWRKGSFVRSADLCRGKVRGRGRGRVGLWLTDMLCNCWVYENSWPRMKGRKTHGYQRPIDQWDILALCLSGLYTLLVLSLCTTYLLQRLTDRHRHPFYSAKHYAPVTPSTQGLQDISYGPFRLKSLLYES